MNHMKLPTLKYFLNYKNGNFNLFIPSNQPMCHVVGFTEDENRNIEKLNNLPQSYS